MNPDQNNKLTLSVNEVIEMATNIGVKAGLEFIQQEKNRRKKNRYDRRLRNTKLLLREYRKLCLHSKDAVSSWKQLTAIDVLDNLDEHEYDEDLYIESIKTSKERTRVIVEHIRKMMRIFRYMSYKSKKPEDRRRFEIINSMYISSVEMTAEELSAKNSVDTSTIYRDVNMAVEDLASLVFGIDGLKIF